jgi:hypothetical protein
VDGRDERHRATTPPAGSSRRAVGRPKLASGSQIHPITSRRRRESSTNRRPADHGYASLGVMAARRARFGSSIHARPPASAPEWLRVRTVRRANCRFSRLSGRRCLGLHHEDGNLTLPTAGKRLHGAPERVLAQQVGVSVDFMGLIEFPAENLRRLNRRGAAGLSLPRLHFLRPPPRVAIARSVL